MEVVGFFGLYTIVAFRIFMKHMSRKLIRYNLGEGI